MPIGEIAGKFLDAAEKVAETVGEVVQEAGESIFPDFFKELPLESDKSALADRGILDQETGKVNLDIEENQETDIEKKDELLSKIQESISTPDGIQGVMERHPEKAEVWSKLIESMNEAIDVLNNPDSSPLEIRSAQNKINGNFSQLKGQLFETAVKDVLSDTCFDVEAQQRILEGESGGTRPDVIAKNNTEQNMQAFDINIKPGETLSIECKCGGSSYMTNQLENHIPNQLSGQEGTKVLLTTSDIKNTPNGLAEAVCEKYDAKLVVTEAGVADVENAIKEVIGV